MEATLKPVASATLREEPGGGRAFDIELVDAELGALSVTIAVAAGRATARLSVADVNAKRLVDAAIGRLENALRERGLKVDAVEVRLMEGGVR